jgi:hypothetical protein
MGRRQKIPRDDGGVALRQIRAKRCKLYREKQRAKRKEEEKERENQRQILKAQVEEVKELRKLLQQRTENETKRPPSPEKARVFDGAASLKREESVVIVDDESETEACGVSNNDKSGPNNVMLLNNFDKIRVPADGNCFFHSILHPTLKGEETSEATKLTMANNLRATLCDILFCKLTLELAEAKAKPGSSVEQLLKRELARLDDMRMPAVFAPDDMFLPLVAIKYGVDYVLWQPVVEEHGRSSVQATKVYRKGGRIDHKLLSCELDMGTCRHIFLHNHHFEPLEYRK